MHKLIFIQTVAILAITVHAPASAQSASSSAKASSLAKVSEDRNPISLSCLLGQPNEWNPRSRKPSTSPPTPLGPCAATAARRGRSRCRRRMEFGPAVVRGLMRAKDVKDFVLYERKITVPQAHA